MTPNTTPAAPNSGNNSRQRLIAIAAVVIVALLALNAWLLYNYTKADRAQQSLTMQLDEATQLQEELNDKYYQAKTDLDAMKGENEEMNALIAQQQTELKEAKDRIAALIRQGGNANAARAEIGKLKEQINTYLAELNQLREENALLTDANQQLSQERDGLRTDLDAQILNNNSLSQERAILVSEKEQLNSRNASLSRKVDQASAIQVSGIEALGQKQRSSGKYVTRRDAENVEQISVTMTTTVNEITEPGTETFLLRIVGPMGETMAIDQMGSGVFRNQTTGEDMRYTLKKVVEYERDARQVGFTWSPGTAFNSGKYQVEIYNKGYLVGATSLVLK
ncbi:MAG: hypothetical protein R2795_15530 [Saprospiraceae bacterium]